MRLTFFGTSAGSPTAHRNVTALALANEDSRDWYLVDCGEGTQHQLLQGRYSLVRLRAIFITHVHGDHCYGLPGLIASANMHGRKAPLTVCAPDGVEQFVRSVFEYTDIRELRFPLEFIRSDEPGFSWHDKQFSISALPLSHRVPCFAYQFTESPAYHLNEDALHKHAVPSGPLWHQLQHGTDIILDDGRHVKAEAVRSLAWQPRRVIIGGDNDQPALLNEALEQTDLLVHEATFTEDVLAKVGPQYMHSTAAMVAKAAEKANLKHLILTHFSQRYRKKVLHPEHQRSIDDLRTEAEKQYSGNLLMAEDFTCVQLERDRQLSSLQQHSCLQP